MARDARGTGFHERTASMSMCSSAPSSSSVACPSTASQRWKSSLSTVTTETRASASRLRSLARPRAVSKSRSVAVAVDRDDRRVGRSVAPQRRHDRQVRVAQTRLSVRFVQFRIRHPSSACISRRCVTCDNHGAREHKWHRLDEAGSACTVWCASASSAARTVQDSAWSSTRWPRQFGVSPCPCARRSGGSRPRGSSRSTAERRRAQVAIRRSRRVRRRDVGRRR